MFYSRFSLRALFGLTAVVAVGLFVYARFQPGTWSSGVHASDIRSATVSGELEYYGGENTWHLSRDSAIELVRVLERCPLKEVEGSLSGCMLPGQTFFMLDIEFSLSRERTLRVSLLGDGLLDARLLERERLLVDVSPAHQQVIRKVLAAN